MARTSFKFRLQRLLEIREMREKKEQQLLLSLRQKVLEEQQKMETLKAEEAALEDRMTLKPGQPLDVLDQQMCAYAIKEKQKEQAQQQQRIVQAEQAVTQQVQVVKQAGIDVKALEKLREKQREEHRLEQLHEQEVFLDDLSGQQFIRQQTQRALQAAEDAEALALASGDDTQDGV